MNEANEFLMSGGLPAASFPHIGATVVGTVLSEPTKRPVTDINTGEIKTFQNGEPIHQITITMQTSERDASIVDDNGQRTLWIKNRMLNAVRDAVRAAGARGIEVGGVLAVTFTGEEASKVRGLNPTKLYVASYTPPPSAGNTALMGGGNGAGTTGAGQLQPAQGSVTYQPAAAGPQSATYQQPAAVAPGSVTYQQPAAVAPQPSAAPMTAASPHWQPPVSQQHATVSAAMTGASNPLAGTPYAGLPATVAAAAPGQPAPPGVDPGAWERMAPEQRAMVTAAMAQTAPF